MDPDPSAISIVKYNYITAVCDGKGNLAKTPAGEVIDWDTSKLMTLSRAKDLYLDVRRRTGKQITEIHLTDCAYTKTPDNEFGDFPEGCLWNRMWRYNSARHELREYCDGDIVSVTDDDGACHDYVALKDSGY
jgi:hypothetical protein